jgi:Fe/S biogenesis protein NfuA
MIQITESAQTHFRRLLDAQGGDAIGIRLSAMHAGTPKADVRLEFAEKGDLDGNEWAVDCEGFTLFIDGDTASYLDGAEIDYRTHATGGELNIRAPKIKGRAPAEGASIPEQVRWLLDNEINPQLASHKGNVRLEEVTADGVVLLRFGGGCHGCGMADVTLKQGIEKQLMAKIPGITAVRDATDHSTGEAPYIAR